MTEPTTAAGKAYHWQYHVPLSGCVYPPRCDTAAAIAAIEREAIAAALARVRERAVPAVNHLAFECKNSRVRQGVGMGANVVLDIIEEEASAAPPELRPVYDPGEERECPCCGEWFRPCSDPEHTNGDRMCAFCALGLHNLVSPCTPRP